MADSLLTRLRTSADRIADLRKATRAEMDRRDSMICEAIGTGGTEYTYSKVAREARRSIGTVAAIVGKGDPLADQGEPELAGKGHFPRTGNRAG